MKAPAPRVWIESMFVAMIATQAFSTTSAALSTLGDVTFMAAPTSVERGERESDTEIALFLERGSLELAADISVDVTAPGTYGSNRTLAPGTISAGTIVNIYLLHADAVGTPSTGIQYQGSVTFANDILGLIITPSGLDLTDSVLGNPTTLYGTGDTSRGINAVAEVDTIQFLVDLRTINIDPLLTEDGIDNIRVITAVPEPGSAALLLVGLIGFACRRAH